MSGISKLLMSDDSSGDDSMEWLNDDNEGSWDSEEELTMLASQFCRICAEACEDLIDCFGELAKNMQLVQKIHTHLPIMVTEEDLLPISVCTSCAEKLEVCHKLVIGCLEADAKLRAILGFESVTNEEQYYYSNTLSNEKSEQTQDVIKKEPSTDSKKKINVKHDKKQALVDSSKIRRSNNSKHQIKPNYKILVLKLKRSSTVSRDLQLKKAIKFLQAGGKTNSAISPSNQSSLKKAQTNDASVKGSSTKPLNSEEASESNKGGAAENEISMEETENTEENDVKYECIYCEGTVTGKQEFVLHQKSVHNNEVFSCEYCELVFELKDDYSEHVETHPEKKQSSAADKNISPTDAPFQPHDDDQQKNEDELSESNNKLKNSDVACKTDAELAGDVDDNEKYDVSLVIEDDGNQYWKCKVWQCRDCHHVSTSKEGYQQHNCNKLQKVECPVCSDQFDTEQQLEKHRFIAHRQQQYRSHIKKEVKSFPVKEERISTNTGQSYDCPTCYKSFSSEQRLQSHLPVHSDGNFPCHICGKVLSKKNTLEYHLRTHTGEKPYTCSMCPSSFQSRVGLLVHERIHTGEKPYPCDMCNMAFRCRATLNQHKVVHSDERPYRCNHCGRGFRRRDTLDTHIRTHTDERPYACRICGRAFRQKGDCSKHERTHAKHAKSVMFVTEDNQLITEGNQSVYSCPLCGLIYELKEDLDNHFENEHTPEEKASSIVIINSENVITIPGIASIEEPSPGIMLAPFQ